MANKRAKREGWPVQGVDHNFNPDWKYKSGTSSIIKDIKSAAKKADKIFIATDPDRKVKVLVIMFKSFC